MLNNFDNLSACEPQGLVQKQRTFVERIEDTIKTKLNEAEKAKRVKELLDKNPDLKELLTLLGELGPMY